MKSKGKGARQAGGRGKGGGGGKADAGGADEASDGRAPRGPESVVDHELVEEAQRWIKRKVGETLHRGLAELGEYLFVTFYGRDVARVRSLDPHKHASFRALAERCDTASLPVSKTSLYNAIGVAVLTHQLPGGTAFKQLPTSHQATLLPLKDPAKVERLAQRALSKELSVRELREIVGAEVSLRDPEAPFRGRPPLPLALKSMRAVSRQLKDDGGRMGWNKTELDKLDDAQAKEALKLVESVLATLTRTAERLRER